MLQTGALPVKFNTVERTDVSATLGKDSLKQARNAAIVGLIVVAIFLLILYRFLGVVAVFGLAIYAALMYGAILLFGVVLTLPGFAGLILTIGVAADANVVIFERIKEEAGPGSRSGPRLRPATPRASSTIVDANVVTAITALILFAVATAEVKGFALMLLLGTVISLFTAVAATRAMLGLLAGFSWSQRPRFMGATASEIPRWQRIDVVTRRRLWFVISLVAVVLSVLALAPGAQPRHRLQGRRADHVLDVAAGVALEGAHDQSDHRRAAMPSSRARAPRPAPTRTRASRSA